MHKFFHCPVCGEEVKVGARMCPECGADEKTGWNQDYLRQDYIYDDLDLPDEEFDYEAFIRKEFGNGSIKKQSRREWLLAGVALFIVIVWILFHIF
jgi:predicted nucleic acid-binding Zn ribbon protein